MKYFFLYNDSNSIVGYSIDDDWGGSGVEVSREEYYAVTGDPRAAEQPEPSLVSVQEARQTENKAALAAWLTAHPLQWTDGNTYGVTEEDQQEMALNLMQYQVAVQAGQPAVLEWHAQKESCRTFEQSEYVALSLAIADYVYPYLRYQESVKEAIYQAQTAEEVANVKIDYASVSG